ncbi:kelch repeat-containing protein [Hyalangium minutum]|uniref:High-affinity leucine-specific transport system, periplasmic binding protein LivK n=1 Tax=Hyalangium minutum TaxID=394096 RepID=A0A085WPT8_9BACT|nr:kelch repeat-containing protein [Hyalangium minutum]KFE69701.1 High-affinity leucine-specific transport system, periplasmic binding protein LivK [Hyalangium minutum]
MKSLSTSLWLALTLVLVTGCSPSAPITSAVQVAVSVPQALSSSDVTRVQVTVSASDMASLSVELASSNGSWGGLIGNIPAGSNRSFLAQAYDASGTLRFQGQTSGVTLFPNQTTAVALILQELSPPPPYANEAPVIDSLVASSTSVLTGGALSLTAIVHDPNPGDTLSLAWTASGGSFSDPAAASTSWTAPSSVGVQTLTLTVTDSQGAAVSVSLAVNVSSDGAAAGNAALNISFNLWPVISKVSASRNLLDAGQSTSVSTLASDADGDALSYAWTASCPGTWTHASSSTASFIPSSVPAGACNNCRLTVTVQDGRGGQNTGSLSLCVAASSPERFAPRFSQFYQSATSTSPGQTVTFDVTALDPQSASLTFAWTATYGSLGTPAHGASTSRIIWTAPSCTPASTASVITVTVTNAFNLSATQSFSVAGLPACVSGWAATGSMASPRYQHTATLLPNGKVLNVGGRYNGGSTDIVAMAEVYDPATGTWSAAGSLVAPRFQHTATLLPNGKVLVAGGRGTGYLASAEVYDPVTGSWSAIASMASPRLLHTATLLPNGKVLVAGGYTGSSYTASAEVYDPATGTWSATGSMVAPRYVHTATLLSNGKVLVAGGYNSSSTYLRTAEVYDPATGFWSAVGSMSTYRGFHPATLLANGKVLVSGGNRSSTDSSATADLYDPATGTWSVTGSMVSIRSGHPAVLLPNGKVLVAGGSGTSTVESYNPALGTWSAAVPMAAVRSGHTATLLTNGTVLVSGGTNGSSGVLTTAAVYSP